MRPLLRAACTLVIAGSLLPAQEPHALCGLPHISAIPLDAPITLFKALAQLKGDRTFRIRKNILSQQAELIPVEFDLLFDDPQFLIYGEVAELDAGRIDAAVVTSLVSAFRDEGRPGSIDPTQGIKALTEQIFGPPTDIDGN
ncbi:MAG: hypothetical protein IIC41_05710, partial [Candidatus Marinimicrobia bacterium]|nr:hypothetical protein [Candidatus Neomarinimicrobiota bacterium]